MEKEALYDRANHCATFGLDFITKRPLRHGETIWFLKHDDLDVLVQTHYQVQPAPKKEKHGHN